jgi:hypothetical protein
MPNLAVSSVFALVMLLWGTVCKTVGLELESEDLAVQGALHQFDRVCSGR